MSIMASRRHRGGQQQRLVGGMVEGKEEAALAQGALADGGVATCTTGGTTRRARPGGGSVGGCREVFDDTLTEEQLATLDALSGLGVGFIRTDTTVPTTDRLIATATSTASQFRTCPAPYTSSSPGGRVPPLADTAAEMSAGCARRCEGSPCRVPSRRLLCRPYHTARGARASAWRTR